VPDDFRSVAEKAPGWPELSWHDQQTLLLALDTINGISTSSRDEVAAATEMIEMFSGAAIEVMWSVITRPDDEAAIETDRKGNPKPDPSLRDNENVPVPGAVEAFDADPSDRLASRLYRDAVDAYIAAEVHPYVPDAWVDHAKTKVAYEIPLTRQFYRYVPPRPLVEIDADIKALEAEIQRLLGEVTA
jgi:type I restriction enzyme M protein